MIQKIEEYILSGEEIRPMIEIDYEFKTRVLTDYTSLVQYINDNIQYCEDIYDYRIVSSSSVIVKLLRLIKL